MKFHRRRLKIFQGETDNEMTNKEKKRKSGDQVRLRVHLQRKLRTMHLFDCFKLFYNLINFLCPLRKLFDQ